MPQRINSETYSANLIVLPNLGDGLAILLSEDPDTRIPKEHYRAWSKAREYVAFLRVLPQRYPFRTELALNVPLIRRGSGYYLDFENAVYTETDESFRDDFNLRTNRKKALLRLNDVARKQINEAVSEIARRRRGHRTPEQRRITVSVKLDDVLGEPDFGFADRRGHGIPEGRAERHKGRYIS